MPQLTRTEMEALYRLSETFVLDDQKSYYRTSIERARKSASQVNLLRALCSLLTGLSAAIAGALVQIFYASGDCTSTQWCGPLGVVVLVLMAIAVIAPAVGGAFNTLADLYQWDRYVSIYEAAEENLGVADAQSPDPAMPEDLYRASYAAFTEGILSVMKDETAQWGQLVQTPPELEQFLARARQQSETAARTAFNQGGALTGGAPSVSDTGTGTPDSKG